jgi:hypothetical protein
MTLKMLPNRLEAARVALVGCNSKSASGRSDKSGTSGISHASSEATARVSSLEMEYDGERFDVVC